MSLYWLQRIYDKLVSGVSVTQTGKDRVVTQVEKDRTVTNAVAANLKSEVTQSAKDRTINGNVNVTQDAKDRTISNEPTIVQKEKDRTISNEPTIVQKEKDRTITNVVDVNIVGGFSTHSDKGQPPVNITNKTLLQDFLIQIAMLKNIRRGADVSRPTKGKIIGDLYIDDTQDKIYLWNGSDWILREPLTPR